MTTESKFESAVKQTIKDMALDIVDTVIADREQRLKELEERRQELANRPPHRRLPVSSRLCYEEITRLKNDLREYQAQKAKLLNLFKELNNA